MIRSLRPTVTALGLAMFTLLLAPDGGAQIVRGVSDDIIKVGRLTPGTLRHNPGAQTGTSSPLGAGVPEDGDGLSFLEESSGWEIAIDELGYGPTAPVQLLTIKHVTSDPNNPDTDGDTLTDDLEWLIGTDPRSEDTDGDGLTDAEEWRGWLSNPNTVDTDGDSRGPQGDLVPNANLFDRYEIAALTGLVPPGTKPDTSPTLADTDGDGRTDFEELFDDGVSPIFAELPTADILIAGNLDIRLDVTYEESVAGEVGYEVSLESSSTSTLGLSESNSTVDTSSTHTEASTSTSFEASTSATVGATAFPPSASLEVSVGLAAEEGTSSSEGTSTELSKESVFTTSSESSQTSGIVRSEYLSDTNTFTETAATGSVTLPIRIFNDGDFSYTLTNLGVTLLSFDPSGIGTEDGPYRAMGTITPQLPSVTLAPGESTPILTLDSGDLNADVVKDFLAAPSTLVLQPASFDLLDQNGIDFDFIRENALAQTALIEIDYGDGVIQSHRVATNVARDPQGNLIGVPLRQVLELDLGLDVETQELQAIGGGPVIGSMGVPVTVLTELEGRATQMAGDTASAFWVVMRNGGYDEGNVATVVTGTPPDEITETFVHFDLIRLFAGDQIKLIFSTDSDGDGLWGVEEDAFGSDENTDDTDLDGLLDRAEAIDGWDVTVSGVTRRVFSDPRLVDTDGDGLDDDDEFNGGVDSSDPREPDTDGDGLDDGEDPFPTIPATRFYVATGEVGVVPPWGDAGDLAQAFALADSLNADGDPTNDVAEIWLTGSTWLGGSPIDFPRGNVRVFGGFQQGDTKLGQRDPDPQTNGTQLVNQPIDFPFGGTLDGVLITGQTTQSGLFGNVVLTNILAIGNERLWINFGDLLIERCVFALNGAANGASFMTLSSGNPTIRDSSFLSNQVGALGGGALTIGGDAQIERCLFQGNSCEVPSLTDPGGGALWMVSQPGDTVTITGSEFVDNASDTTVPFPPFGDFLPEYPNGRGGAISTDGAQGTLNVINSRFFRNIGGEGSVFYLNELGPSVTVAVSNSSFSRNLATAMQFHGVFSDVFPAPADVILRNVVTYENIAGHETLEDQAASGVPFDLTKANLAAQLNRLDEAGGSFDISFSLVGGITEGVYVAWLATNLWDTDPGFQAASVGDLRLVPGSPCVDTGLSFFDVDLTTPGIQLPPATDLDGNPRIVDGNGFGGAIIDMGAYELQQ